MMNRSKCWVLAASLCVVSGGHLLAASQSDAEPGPSRHDLQRYLVIGYPVDIPDGYRGDFEKITRKSPQKKLWVVDTVTNKINVEAVYPDMRMPLEIDYDVKRRMTPGEDVVQIQIDPIPGFPEPYSARRMREQVAAGKCNAKKFGDICSDFSGISWSTKQMLYLGTGYDFARCSINDELNIYPQCMAELMLIDDIVLHLRFDRRVWAHALDIRKKVFELVCSWFEWPRGKGADPAGRPLTIDHCR